VSITATRDAGQQLAHGQSVLDDQLRRRWPRRDKTAVSEASNEVDAARRRLAENGRIETEARGHLTDLNRHQKARDAALAATAAERHALNYDISQLDTALHLTRVDRVLQLVGRPTQLHLDVLGPVPAGAAGRAAWCHQASRLEHHLDHASGNDETWNWLVDDLSVTPTLARIADRHIGIQSHHQLRLTDWAPITEHASGIHAATIEHARPSHRGLELELSL
jgi:hypothetical protein